MFIDKLLKIYIFILLIPISSAFAQSTPIDSTLKIKYLVELGISANAYHGDLSYSVPTWGASFQAGIKFNPQARFNSHLNVSIGSISGENFAYSFSNEASPKTSPNIFFKTNIFTLNYDLQYNFIKKRHWAVYFSQGLGILRFMPKNENGEKLQDIITTRPKGENYSNISVCFPTSLGGTYLLDNGYGVGLQASMLNPITDYIDNISQWGTKSGNDKIWMVKFYVLIPFYKKTSSTPVVIPIFQDDKIYSH